MDINLINLQTPYADTDPNAKTAKVVPTKSGAASLRYVPVFEAKGRFNVNREMRVEKVASTDQWPNNEMVVPRCWPPCT